MRTTNSRPISWDISYLGQDIVFLPSLGRKYQGRITIAYHIGSQMWEDGQGYAASHYSEIPQKPYSILIDKSELRDFCQREWIILSKVCYNILGLFSIS